MFLILHHCILTNRANCEINIFAMCWTPGRTVVGGYRGFPRWDDDGPVGRWAAATTLERSGRGLSGYQVAASPVNHAARTVDSGRPRCWKIWRLCSRHRWNSQRKNTQRWRRVIEGEGGDPSRKMRPQVPKVATCLCSVS